jgi:hypothetical protein
MSRKPLASLGACVVTLALAAGVLAQTPAMQDAKKKTTPVSRRPTSSPRASL